MKIEGNDGNWRWGYCSCCKWADDDGEGFAACCLECLWIIPLSGKEMNDWSPSDVTEKSIWSNPLTDTLCSNNCIEFTLIKIF